MNSRTSENILVAAADVGTAHAEPTCIGLYAYTCDGPGVYAQRFIRIYRL